MPLSLIAARFAKNAAVKFALPEHEQAQFATEVRQTDASFGRAKVASVDATEGTSLGLKMREVSKMSIASEGAAY